MFSAWLPILLITLHYCNSISEIKCPVGCFCDTQRSGYRIIDTIHCSPEAESGITLMILQHPPQKSLDFHEYERQLNSLRLTCQETSSWSDFLHGSTLNLDFIHKVDIDSCTLPRKNNESEKDLSDILKQVGVRLEKLKSATLERVRSDLELTDLEPFKYATALHIENNNPQYLKLDFLTDDQVKKKETPAPTEKKVFSSLQILSLASNQLPDMYIDTVSRRIMEYFPSLVHLDISYNNLQTLKAFNPEGHNRFPARIMLTNNYIKQIDTSIEHFLRIAKKRRQIIMIYLGSNPIDCSCSLYSLLPYIGTTNLQRIDVHSSSCSTPIEMYGVELSTINSKTFTCPLININSVKDDPCAHEGPCNCTARPDDKSLFIDCSSRQLIALPNLAYVIGYDSVELNMEENLLTEVVIGNTSINYDKVTSLTLGKNKIERIEVGPIAKNLKRIQLHGNMLMKLDRRFVEYLSGLKLSEMTIHNNPWICDCTTVDLVSLIKKQFSIISEIKYIRCQITNEKLIAMTEGILCPDTQLSLVIGTLIAVFGFLLGSLAALYYRFRREILAWLFSKNMCLSCLGSEDPDNDKIYDVFISYSHKDEDFVVRELLTKLEGDKNPYKVCVHFRDWIPGEYIPTQIIRSVQESKRTILVISPNFIQSVWGRLEFQTAHRQTLNENKRRVIPIMYGKIESMDELDSDLQVYLKMHTFIEWGDSWFWEKLKFALHHGRCSGKKTSGIV